MEIVMADRADVEELATVVRDGNRDVAHLFNLNNGNAPRHPSFCTPEWIVGDFERGQLYFMARQGGRTVGCVAFEQPDARLAYLNRLSVLPQYRRNGLGTSLVNHIVDLARDRAVEQISIGIIAEHLQLRQWYGRRGFVEGEEKRFAHLPFTVLYMRYQL